LSAEPRRRAPSHRHVVAALARRELAIASRQKLVRLFFLGSVVPPLVLGIILVVRVLIEKSVGTELGWDPVLQFLRIQAFPVGILALGLGTPSVSRDRAEDVLYLYAVRPVMPWHYAVGKMLAVAVPTFLLLMVPGLLIAVLRQGILGDEVRMQESLLLIAKVFVVSTFMAAAFSGISVGPSAAVKRARWALLLAIGLFIVPGGVGEILHHFLDLEVGKVIGPDDALVSVMDALFSEGTLFRAVGGIVSLSLYGFLGFAVTMARVRTEMTP